MMTSIKRSCRDSIASTPPDQTLLEFTAGGSLICPQSSNNFVIEKRI